MSARLRSIGIVAATVVLTATVCTVLQPGLGQAAGTGATSVDGFSAVGCSASTRQRAGKLVATCKSNGRLPNNIIAKAPDSARLGGQASSAYLRAAQVDTRTFSCAGSAMTPASDTTVFDTDGPLVLSQGGAFRCNAVLPDGAVVTKVTATTRNNDPTGSISCQLLRTHLDIPTTANDVMATIGPVAAESGDTVTPTTTISGGTVNNATFTYRIGCAMSGSGGAGSLGVFGTQVTYRVSAANG